MNVAEYLVEREQKRKEAEEAKKKAINDLTESETEAVLDRNESAAQLGDLLQ